MAGWSVAGDRDDGDVDGELTPGTCEATQPAVTAVPPQCVAGTVTLGTVTPVAVTGVTYEPAEVTTVELGQPVTVTATLDPDEDFAWAAPDQMPGWEIVSATEATYEVTFEEIECVAAASTTTSSTTTHRRRRRQSTTTTSTTERRRRRSTTDGDDHGRRRRPRPRDDRPPVARPTTAAPTTTAAATTTVPAAPANVMVTGNAVCAPESGQTTLTWTVRNVGGSPVTITGDNRGVSFTPTQLLANTSATGSEVIDGPAADEAVTETVTRGRWWGPDRRGGSDGDGAGVHRAGGSAGHLVHLHQRPERAGRRGR